MPRYSYVIVGSGLTGATLARHLHDAGESVIVLDRRTHLGGNVADYTHSSGINVHRYGPHLFRTVSDDVWAFVNRFAAFYPYAHQVRTLVDGRLEQWPIASSYIRRTCGENWAPAATLPPNTSPSNFEEAALSLMPRLIYEKFVKPYTEKQWAVPARTLAVRLCGRFDVRHDGNPYLTPKAKYQGLPIGGYSALMENMLAGIPTILNFNYLADRSLFSAAKRTIFTGPIDEFFNFELGKLTYRAQRRTHAFYELDDQQPSPYLFPCGVVNNPAFDNGQHVREIEWKRMMQPVYSDAIRGTLITSETPYTPTDPNDYEYPFPDEVNRTLLESYQKLAATAAPEVTFAGRLGTGRYLDMDGAISHAMAVLTHL